MYPSSNITVVINSGKKKSSTMNEGYFIIVSCDKENFFYSIITFLEQMFEFYIFTQILAIVDNFLIYSLVR